MIKLKQLQYEDPEKCPIKWDTVMCWPESNVNKTIELPCANYVNKFNKKRNFLNFFAQKN